MRLRSDIIWTVGVMLIVIVVLMAMTIGMARLDKPENRALYLSYGRHQRGVKAFARLLEMNGYRVRPLRKPFGQLPSDADLIVIFPAPPEVIRVARYRWTEVDVDALEKWLRAGGRVMIMEGDDRLAELNPVYDSGVPPKMASRYKGDRFIAEPLMRVEWLKGVQTVTGSDLGVRLTVNGERWVPILGDKGGVTMALRFDGKGIVLESMDADLFTNEKLSQAQNGHFALSSVHFLLPKGGTVYFDDAGQGDLEAEKAKGFWDYVPAGGKVAYTHLLLLTAIVLYSLSRRFGLPRPVRMRAPSMKEYVTALAQLYENAHASHAALSILTDQVRREAARRYGFPSHYTLLQLVQALPEKVPVRQALQRAHEALQKPSLDETEALQVAQDLSRAL